MNEFDPRHFQFTRNTGLPRGTFDQEQNWGDRFVIAVCAVGAVVIVLMIMGAIN